MAIIKYHSKGISKNKKIREQRKKPLPLGLMKNDKIIRIDVISDGTRKNTIFS